VRLDSFCRSLKWHGFTLEEAEKKALEIGEATFTADLIAKVADKSIGYLEGELIYAIRNGLQRANFCGAGGPPTEWESEVARRILKTYGIQEFADPPQYCMKCEYKVAPNNYCYGCREIVSTHP